MAEKTRKKVSAKSLAARYERVDLRTERVDRLCEILPGIPDPLEAASREELIARSEWASLDTRRRNRALGFLRRSNLVGRHMLRPPATYLRSPTEEPLGKQHLKAIKLPKVPFRYKDVPMAALAPKGTLPVSPLLALVPRLVATPTEDLPVILNSRLFHFYWQHYFPRKAGAPAVPPEERLAAFDVPMMNRKTGAPFREARDRLLELAEDNSERLARPWAVSLGTAAEAIDGTRRILTEGPEAEWQRKEWQARGRDLGALQRRIFERVQQEARCEALVS